MMVTVNGINWIFFLFSIYVTRADVLFFVLPSVDSKVQKLEKSINEFELEQWEIVEITLRDEMTAIIK